MDNWIQITVRMKAYSGRQLKLCATLVAIIRTSKHFWLLQCIWNKTRVTYPWSITTFSHWNHFVWSQKLWEHKFMVFKNGLTFYRFMVEWVFLLHKITIKGLKAIIKQSALSSLQLSFCEEEKVEVMVWICNLFNM